MRVTRIFLAGWLALGAAGCGDSPFETAPVSGKVTLNGQPLADARITFQPIGSEKEQGPGSATTTDAEGKFTLTTAEGRRGATVGKHQVHQHVENERGQAHGRCQLPARASNPANVQVPEKVPLKYGREAPLTFDVPKGGTDSANFDLTGDPPPVPKTGAPPRARSPGTRRAGAGNGRPPFGPASWAHRRTIGKPSSRWSPAFRRTAMPLSGSATRRPEALEGLGPRLPLAEPVACIAARPGYESSRPEGQLTTTSAANSP